LKFLEGKLRPKPRPEDLWKKLEKNLAASPNKVRLADPLPRTKVFFEAEIRRQE
jgi:hypothetical protein